MTGNRLTSTINSAATQRMTVDDMRAWCWERNRQAREFGWPNWLHVSTDKETGTSQVKCRTGADATDVIKVINGWYPDFMNWPADRLDSEFRILRHMAKMGMTDEAFAKARCASPPRVTERVGIAA